MKGVLAMKKSILLVSILIVIIFVLASCSGAVGTMYSAVQNIQAPTSVTASMAAASGATAAADEKSGVSIESSAYNTAAIADNAGATVT